MRVSELCFQIALELGLTTFLDYRLFLVGAEGYGRMLFDDEILDEVMEQHNPLNPNVSKKIPKLMDRISYFFNKNEISKDLNFIYRKAVFLGTEDEKNVNGQEPKRLHLFVSQLFLDIARGVFLLDYGQYQLAVAISAYLRIGGIEEKDKRYINVKDEDIQKAVPRHLLVTKPLEDWRQGIQERWIKLTKEINELVGTGNDGNQGDLEFIRKTAAANMLYSLVVSNPLYGCMIYLVQIAEETLKHLKPGFPITVFLAVKESGLHLFNSTTKELLKTIGIGYIKSVYINHKTIHFRGEDIVYKFSTHSSLEIATIFELYQGLFRFHIKQAM
eukprot:TRINITY_DN8569_c0_g1_i2.p1 TRINITY_DN8569_c0_g1~~TRINITY_DN8569_c0_g1_i2.p1  ORF type:complete len:330 (-),score=58.28 TRINITY_DN8569_c0_g1_i2:26-1015(-)